MLFWKPSQESPGQKHKGDAEIDNDPRHVDDGRHEWGRGTGGIEVQGLQGERQHRASERTKGHEPDESRANGERE